MSRIPEAIKRRRALVSIVVIVLLLGLVFGGGAYLGMFSDTTLTQTQTTSAVYVLGITHQGRYGRAPRVVDDELRPLLAERSIDAGTGETAVLIQDYPWQKEVPRKERRSVAGVLLHAPVEPMAAPLTVETFPAGAILSAKTSAHPSIASYRLFPKIQRWLTKNGYETAGPALEIYGSDGIVEVQVPIRKLP